MTRLVAAVLCVLGFLVGIPAGAVGVSQCDKGFQAFQASVYTKIRRDCAGCHDGSKSGIPPFASADPFKSYSHLSAYVNFGRIPESLLVIRSGNNHCEVSLCQADSGKEMADQVAAWWKNGESDCQRNGVYFSNPVALPTLAPIGDGFVTMTFDLSSLKSELKGVSFQIEIQNYMDASNQTNGAIRFRSPRLVGGTNSIYVKDVKVMLNGTYAPIYNIFSTIDRSFPFLKIADAAGTATPLLSGETLLMLKDGAPNPTVTVSFGDIHISSDAPACPNEAGFVSQVKPLLASLSCVGCHNSKGASIGEKTLDLGADDSRQCGALSALIDPNYLMLSSAIKVPAGGLAKHPQLSDDERARLVSALKIWLNK